MTVVTTACNDHWDYFGLHFPHLLSTGQKPDIIVEDNNQKLVQKLL